MSCKTQSNCPWSAFSACFISCYVKYVIQLSKAIKQYPATNCILSHLQTRDTTWNKNYQDHFQPLKGIPTSLIVTCNLQVHSRFNALRMQTVFEPAVGAHKTSLPKLENEYASKLTIKNPLCQDLNPHLSGHESTVIITRPRPFSHSCEKSL